MLKTNQLTERDLRLINTQLTKVIMFSLIGYASKKMRGITYQYDILKQSIRIIVFFDSELTQEESDMYTLRLYEKLTETYRNGISYNFDDQKKFIIVDHFYYDKIIIPSDKVIINQIGNLGWGWFRKEYC